MPEITELSRRVSDLEAGLSIIRGWQQQIDISRAREDENRKHMDAQFAKLQGELAGIKGVFNKILLTIGTGFIGAFILFIVNGGLAK